MIQPEIEHWLDRRAGTTIRRILSAKTRVADRRLAAPMREELQRAITEEVNDFARDVAKVIEALSTGDILVNGVVLRRLDEDSDRVAG